VCRTRKKPGAGPSFLLRNTGRGVRDWEGLTAPDPLNRYGAAGFPAVESVTGERSRVRMGPWDASGSQVPLFLWIASWKGLSRRPFLFKTVSATACHRD
jgi:hypothetical protein